MKQNLLRISGALFDFDKSVSSCFKAHRKQLVLNDNFMRWDAILSWSTLLLHFTHCKEEERKALPCSFFRIQTQPRAANWWCGKMQQARPARDSQGMWQMWLQLESLGVLPLSLNLGISFFPLQMRGTKSQAWEQAAVLDWLWIFFSFMSLWHLKAA